MSSEITTNFSLTYVNGNASDSVKPRQLQIDQSTAKFAKNIQSIGTSEEDIAYNDVATAGYIWMKNCDSTNFITYGPKITGAMQLLGKLKAGEECFFRLSGSAVLRAKADTGACDLEYLLLAD